jgi:hypothetical protein
MSLVLYTPVGVYVKVKSGAKPVSYKASDINIPSYGGGTSTGTLKTLIYTVVLGKCRVTRNA